MATLADSAGQAGDEVNAVIVLAFALLGLLLDAVSIAAFTRNHRRLLLLLLLIIMIMIIMMIMIMMIIIRSAAGALQVNMLAAFAHVAADFARSVTKENKRKQKTKQITYFQNKHKLKEKRTSPAPSPPSWRPC